MHSGGGSGSDLDRHPTWSKEPDDLGGHEAIDQGSGIVINPAGLTFRSIPILDALKMFPGPIVEVHITNIHKREEFRHKSYVAMVATGTIAGLGVQGYGLAIEAVKELLAKVVA